jgi:hypothetical protein
MASSSESEAATAGGTSISTSRQNATQRNTRDQRRGPWRGSVGAVGVRQLLAMSCCGATVVVGGSRLRLCSDMGCVAGGAKVRCRRWWVVQAS